MIVSTSLVRTWRANKSFETNTRNSPIYALSFELIHSIIRYLDQSDITCLALSSSKLHGTLVQSLIPSATNRKRSDTQKRLLRDDYYQNRFSTRAHRLCHKIWCANCACLHHRSEFPEETSTQPQWERNCCKSVDGCFRACQHELYTFDRMKATVVNHKQFGPEWRSRSFFKCRQCVRNLYLGGRFMTPPSLYIEPCTSEVVLKARIRLFSSRHEDDVRVADIREALTGIDDAICPHMTTSDPGLIDCLLHGRTRIFLSASVSIRVSVQCNFCQTKLSVKRRVTADEVVLDIKRRLGHVERETDPIWRAQLEPKGV